MKNLIKPFFYLAILMATSFLMTSCEDTDDQQFDSGEEDNQEEISINTPCRYDITLLDTAFSHDATTGNRSCVLGSTGSNNPNTGINTRIPEAGLVDLEDGYGLTLSRGSVSFDATQGSTPSNDAFTQLFATGDYDFSMDAVDGFQIQFMDDNGVEWSSSHSEALANSSWINISESVHGEKSGTYYVTIRGNFSCGVANSNGEVKGCSGNFVLSFSNE